MKKLFFVCLCLLSCCSAYAESIVYEIEDTQKNIELIEDKIFTKIGLMIEDNAVGCGNSNYSALNSTVLNLGKIYIDLTALNREHDLLSLITNEENISSAISIVNTHKKYIYKVATMSNEIIVKRLQEITDNETTQLLLEARDIFNRTIKLTQE